MSPYVQQALEHRNTDWRQAWEERAAILEFEADLPRDDAEKLAVDMTDRAFRLEGRTCGRYP